MSIDFKSHINSKRGSDKMFGLIFALIFFIISVILMFLEKQLFLIPLVVCILLSLISFIKPSVLSSSNDLWNKFGILLGVIISPIIILAVYIVGIIPTGIYVKITKKNLLMKEYDKDLTSYWIIRKNPVGTMKSQF